MRGLCHLSAPLAHLNMQLTADLIEAFSGVFLSPRYDGPCPTPEFHRLAWDLYTSSYPQAACAAPRDHAKSTALTMDFILAEVLFRSSDYVILIGSTEDKAAEQLSNIAEELHDNQDIRSEFGVAEFEVESRAEIIVRMNDGHRFRILARGSEQKIRGAMWKGKRPNLIVCDDIEDDEQVESRERRRKFRKWFFRAAKQALSQSGRIRVHGTILHEDSLLARLMKNKTWKHLHFKAHRSFGDFSDLLWPERWTEAKLRARRQEFIEDGDSGGYSQEFLNDPQDSGDPYLRKDDFIAMSEDDRMASKIICASADFAVSKADLANRTSFTIGGKDNRNILHVIEERVGRWASQEVLHDGTKVGWIEEMFSINERYNPEIFWVEDGVIWKAVAPIIYREMQVRDQWINIMPLPSIKDKATRGRSLQRRMRAGGMRFDKEAEWYPDYEQELLRFRGETEATLDDQFDSTANLSRGFDTFKHVEDDDFMSEDEEDFEREARGSRPESGRSSVTGY